MKIVYIAHPIGGNVEENLADLRRIIKKINLTFFDVVPLCPYYSDVVSLDDSIPEQRARGIKNGMAVLKSGLINEFWLTGDKISNGMAAELELAKEQNIEIFNFIKNL